MRAGELGDDDQFAELETCGDHLFAEWSQVVLVTARDLSNEAMQAQAFEQSGHLAAALARQEPAQGLILQAADVELAAGDGAKQVFVFLVEEVEAGVGATFVALCLRQLVELVAPVARAFDGR